MILISDIHGCFNTLIQLLKQCPDEEIIFLGDLVDRGPRSKEVVQFTIDQKIPCTKGNHDFLMSEDPNNILLGEPIWKIWANNGGAQTLASYEGIVDPKHIQFLESLPYYIEYENVLLSHTGNGKYGKDTYEKIWMRELMEPDVKFRIFGHSTVEKVTIDKISANIDTGCAYKRYGTLSALQWPSMQVYTQKNCD